jgi:hypothetical protein
MKAIEKNELINLNLSKEEIDILIEALFYAPSALNEESKKRPSYEEGNRKAKNQMREIKDKLYSIKNNW